MTREEAIEFIAQSVKSDVDMAKVADAIKVLEQEQKWIPVSEKMPGHYEVVLACCNDDFVTLASFSYKEDRWECLTNMSSNTHFPENEEVIAWMPLPEPYKAESASEKEKLKAEVNGYFYSLNADGKIDWQTYNTLYNVCMSILEKYYDRTEKERRAESEKEMNNKRAVTTEKDQKIGKWRYDGKTLICSICNTWFHITDRTTYMRRCPYCGAKMESEDRK